jgi:entericidin A
MKKLTFLMLLCLAAMVTGCNTVKGFGQDLQKLGGKIDEKATPK